MDERECADAVKVAISNLPEENQQMVAELFSFLHTGMHICV